MNALNKFGPLVGRILIALIFVASGAGKIAGFDGTVGYIASKGLPLPQLAAIAAIIVELGGGLAVILGWKARWAAAAMLIFTASAAVIFHNFWGVPADQAQNQMIHFMKNISMMGGLLFVIIHGSGALSLDGSGKK
ncbi:DoxX family protein [Undibacterium sp. 5I1]|uniref:DoxX family protein n=1 Tax=unclassified Undibacterium TaxID=2630295 RepID=UPI002AB339AA|nr:MULTISPECIES: DoxX family protein [unclassified Undibacterium]MDY7539357.1 DoxX family protein [Undibacterium sp. 5I1]MEB0231184.1 DoxX family protein [Undibacterium sp. 10I3]MEB0258534.1 DoxX family protein [Undibacterium sp. 5I1]